MFNNKLYLDWIGSVEFIVTIGIEYVIVWHQDMLIFINQIWLLSLLHVNH